MLVDGEEMGSGARVGKVSLSRVYNNLVFRVVSGLFFFWINWVGSGRVEKN